MRHTEKFLPRSRVVSAVMEKACPPNGVSGGDVDEGGRSAHTNEAGDSFLTQTPTEYRGRRSGWQDRAWISFYYLFITSL